MIGTAYRWIESMPVRGKLSLSHALVVALLFVLAGVFVATQQAVELANAWADHSREVIRASGNLRSAVAAEEAAARAWLLSGEPVLKDEFGAHAAHVDAQLENLRRLTIDNPAQQQNLERLQARVEGWRGAMQALSVPQASDAGSGQALDRMRRASAAESFVSLERFDAEERRLMQGRDQHLQEQKHLSNVLAIGLCVAGFLIGYVAVSFMNRLIGEPLGQLAELGPHLSEGKGDVEIPHTERDDEIGAMAGALRKLQHVGNEQARLGWMQKRAAEIAGALQLCDTDEIFGETLLRRLGEALGMGYALAYRWREERASLVFCAAYGLPDPGAVSRRFRLGEGLVGQCMVERRMIEVSPVPAGFLPIVSGLGSSNPQALLFLPLIARGETVAVLELAFLRPAMQRDRDLLDQVVVTSALAWQSLARSQRTRELLTESQAQAQELRASEEALRGQREELRATNEALRKRGEQLEEQGRRLRASEEELRAQSEELRVTNTVLEEKTEALRTRQAELEAARLELERRAQDLEQASRYKSEFLANMSHELRTPLNSMLILSKVLADNTQSNLDAEQVEAARVVHDSGTTLLTLINDILDLSKVEAGKMQVTFESVEIGDIVRQIERGFRPMATHRELRYTITVEPGAPERIRTDGPRLVQILSNLLSNALKFTHEGGVDVVISRAECRGAPGVRFAVRDTGIGIPAEKFARVFQAFEQADTGTSRRYGGTGLGLSIVRGLTGLLGGEVRVESRENQGSLFTVTLPEAPPIGVEAAALPPQRSTAAPPRRATAEPPPNVAVEAAAAATDGPSLLIVEDDADFAGLLAEIAGRRGLRAVIAPTGRQALKLVGANRPAGILMDLGLPDMSGWDVLDRLKREPATRDIPVHIISASDEAARGLAAGAVGYLVKPVTREAVLGALDRVVTGRGPRRLLLVDDDNASRLAVHHLLENEDAEIVEARNAAEAMKALESSHFDGVILDLGLPDVSGFELLERTAGRPSMPPVIVYSDRELTPEENLTLRGYTGSIVIKGVRSPERLLDEVKLFLHALDSDGTSAEAEPHAPLADVVGKTVLVVDDDMRNVFALSKALRARGLNVLMAQDGHKALAQLESSTAIDLVLMDIMMPGMDGYETTRRIRAASARHPEHRGDGQGDEGRPRAVPRGRRQRLLLQADRHRAADVAHSRLGLGSRFFRGQAPRECRRLVTFASGYSAVW